MQHFVDEKFKIDIFLDTNVLVDYVLGVNPSLTHSIEYLNNKRAVRLRSSHYVEFELTEVLKICFFGQIVFGHYPNKSEKAEIRTKDWNVNGINYGLTGGRNHRISPFFTARSTPVRRRCSKRQSTAISSTL